MELLQTTAILRKQHEKLAGRILEVQDLLTPEELALSKKAIHERNLLSEFIGVLDWHFGMEDEFFYPELLKHENAELREMTKRYIDEIGGLKKRFEEYNKKWEEIDSIKDDPNGFVEETRDIFDALSERIQRENNELFVFIETLEHANI